MRGGLHVDGQGKAFMACQRQQYEQDLLPKAETPEQRAKRELGFPIQEP